MIKDDLSNIDLSSFQLDGIDTRDYPDFCDAFVCYGEYSNGEELSDEDYDVINDEYRDLVYDLVISHLY